MLSFAEEIYLLALDDVTGKIVISSKEVVLNTALLGAVLSDLSFHGKIDNDSEKLFILDTDPVGNRVLDEVLGIFDEMEAREISLQNCLRILLPKASKIEKLVVEELLEKGILKKVEEKVLWFFPSRRYPIINDQEIVDVETRLHSLITGSEIPDPRDAVLVSLVSACGLFEEILSPREMRRYRDRINSLAKLDLVGQKVNELIHQINDFNNLPPFV